MKQSSSARRLLLPLVPVYRLALAVRDLRLRRGWEPTRHLRFPVVSIGNLSTGGSGKTPLAITLARLLSSKGFHVDVLSRGYGRNSSSPARVRSEGSVNDFGDEPILIARNTGVPVYVASERYKAGLLAEAEASSAGFEDHCVHLLDDGFQHRQLARDVDILLLNRADWADHLLPSGNLRESLRAFHRATVLGIPAEEKDLAQELKNGGWEEPIWYLYRRMEVPSVAGSVAAFCGIARPEQFFTGLKAAGVSVAAQIAFPDHHRYAISDVERLVNAARTAGAAALITTEKDFVRLGDLAAKFDPSVPLKTATLHVEIENHATVLDWLIGRFPASPVRPAL
jgi:tetraacyldisaccharide 4'-kinase